MGCVAALLLVGATVTDPAQAQTFGGNESMSWSVSDAPSAGMTSLTFPMTVGASTSRRSGTYFAMQFNFAGQQHVGYTGLQPRPDAGGRQQLRGVFSSFIAGTTSSDPNCSNGADGGPGVSCGVNFTASYGHQYDITVKQVGADRWEGSATDTTTGISTHIGSYTLPKGSGLLRNSQGGFVEYYSVPSCSKQPFYDITFGKPHSGSLTGAVKWNYEYGNCRGAGNTTVDATADGGVRITRGTVDRPPTQAPRTTDRLR